MDEVIQNPVIQYGFAGMSLVLLGMLAWMFRVLVQVVKENTKAFTAFNAKVATELEILRDLQELNRALYNKIITRPCIARREQE
ncbi:MAG: hypothetical protein JXA57_15220 [Armatimonadetes bacterium]|nr:hypothetical protein [Armatimonadota bacterium]